MKRDCRKPELSGEYWITIYLLIIVDQQNKILANMTKSEIDALGKKTIEDQSDVCFVSW
jgi:hypothetical protein